MLLTVVRDEAAGGARDRPTQDEDFDSKIESLRTRLHGKARQLEKQVELVVNKDDNSISFRMPPTTINED
jgi:hypothetical protein